jgi:hypothetical protein
LLQAKYGKFEVEDVFFAASNARSGSLYRFSCITIGDEMKFTFHPAAPIVDAETNEKYADALLEMLEIVSGVKDVSVEESKNPLEYLPKNSLALAAAAVGSVALLSHAGAYFQFLQSVMQMKQNVENPADFWDALNFWVFFAVGHPILPPILWISDVLHGSPGPKVADLVPYTFLAGNVIFITAFTFSKEVSRSKEDPQLATEKDVTHEICFLYLDQECCECCCTLCFSHLRGRRTRRYSRSWGFQFGAR